MTFYMTYMCILLMVHNTKANVSFNVTTFRYNYQHFTHLLYYFDNGGYIIAATKNYLLKFLATDLTKPLEVRETGPIKTSKDHMMPINCSLCSPVDVYVKTWTRSENKLIVCYNVYNGYCEVMNLSKGLQSNSFGKAYSIVTFNASDHSTILYYEKKLYVAIEIERGMFDRGIVQYVLSIRTLPNFKLIDYLNDDLPRSGLGYGNDVFYPIEFKGSFYIKETRVGAVFSNYIFFLLNQPENKLETSRGKFQVRLERICSKDEDFSSFIDVGLICGDVDTETFYKVDSWHLAYVGKHLSDWFRKNTRYKQLYEEKEANFDQVLFINFKVIKIYEDYLITLPKFVTCAFPVADIMEAFDVVKKRCHNADGNMNLRPFNYLTAEEPCTKSHLVHNQKGFCSHKDPNLHMIGDHYGSNGATGHQILTKNGVTGTSILVFPVYENYTMALIGTNEGNLFQYEIYENKTKELGSRKMFDTAVLEIKIEENQRIAYARSNSKLGFINLTKCDAASSCDDCLTMSPLCGWCILKSRCSLKTDCIQSIWMPYNRDKKICPKIIHLSPHNIVQYSNNKSPTVKFEISNVSQQILSKYSNDLWCNFYSKSDILVKRVRASLTPDSIITCSGITQGDLSLIPYTENFISLDLKVSISESLLVQSQFFIFDCTRSKTCSKCTDNQFECSWCILDNKCVDKSSNVCIHSHIIEHKKSQECPMFELLSKKIVFPTGSNIEIDFQVKNFDVYKRIQLKFLCKESCRNGTVNVIQNQSLIKCQFPPFNTLSVGAINCSVSVIWKHENSISGFLENSNTLSFGIYNCSNLAEYCDDCLLLNKDYRCGYCIKSNKCTIETFCDKSTEKWITYKDKYCPSPVINEISPANSTLLSKTVILVKGRNLGFEKIDINTSISFENNLRVIKCILIDLLYIPSKQFYCQIKETFDAFDTPVTFDFVYRSSKSSHLAKREFTFYTPVISNITPIFGPIMSGTIVRIYGVYLNIGSNKTVLFNSGSFKTTCVIIENQGSALFCRLNEFKKTIATYRRKRSVDEAFISLIIDSKRYDFPKVSYTFHENPNDIKISRQNFLKNGGQILKVTGTNIDIINNVNLLFVCNSVNSSLCKCKHQDKYLICLTPAINLLTTECDLHILMETTVTLYMTKVSIFPLPTFANISRTKILPSTSWSFITKISKEESIIKIKFDAKEKIHLMAFDSKDIHIYVGKLVCHNVVLTTTSVECNLFPNDVIMYTAYPVIINISDNIQMSLGTIQFSKGEISLDAPSLLIIVILTVIAFGVIIFIAVLVVKKMNKKNKEKYKNRNIFTEKIDREATEIIKQGIVELNDIAIQNEVNKNYLAMYPQSVYILYNLFPNTHPRFYNGNKTSNDNVDSILDIDGYKYNVIDPTSHPLLFDKPIQVIEHTVEYSRKLSKLFEDELFVLILFSFLEDDDVHESKKSDIVSLLSLILTQDMSNYSVILKFLIKDDYDKKKESGKSMFRESDLLSKLLSNWFIILMYDHFQKHNPGGDLLTLFFIIRSVINNGPVDFVSHKSQYALNENALLTSKINSQKLRIKVVYPKLTFLDENNESEIEIDILSCDAIPQVKQKIFEEACKYTPYSQWYDIDEFELGKCDSQYDQSEEQRLLKDVFLEGIDRETNKYKTVSDYMIKDGDTLYLSNKENFSRSESVSACHSKTASLKTSNNVKMNNLIKDSQEFKTKEPRHLLFNSVSDVSIKTNVSCCNKKVIENEGDSKDMNTCCLIYTQVLKKRLEPYIKLLFDDILDQDLVPHCVKDLFTYFNAICKDDKALFEFKSNSLILRFWVQFIQNIDFLYDIPLEKNQPVLKCLQCISKVLMDASSECQNNNWLTYLFSDIIKEYSPKVAHYYESVNFPEETSNAYYSSSRIEGINISLAIVILYRNYIKPIHDKFIEAIKKSNKPIDRQNKWITILKEVNNLYSPDVFFSNGNSDYKTSVC